MTHRQCDNNSKLDSAKGKEKVVEQNFIVLKSVIGYFSTQQGIKGKYKVFLGSLLHSVHVSDFMIQ